MKKELKMEWVTVTPELAMQWLDETNTLNRPVSDKTVQNYARDMAEGRWLKRSTNPVKFDTDGVLLNGQHRLWAIVESGVTLEMLVFWNVNPEERFVEDTGLKRTVTHALAFEGKAVSNLGIAISNRMMASFRLGGFNPTHAEQREFYLAHEESVNFVLEALGTPVKGIRRASLLAPIARAYYTQSHEKLRQFLLVLRTGLTTDAAESAAVLLRNFVMLSTNSGRGKHGQDLYAKAERALLAFLRGEELQKIVACTSEQFPIAADGQGKAAGAKSIRRKPAAKAAGK